MMTAPLQQKKQTYTSRSVKNAETLDAEIPIVKKKARSTTSKNWKTLYPCLHVEDLPRAFWQMDDLSASFQSKGLTTCKEAWIPSRKYTFDLIQVTYILK
jgi:hypothetical protein